MNKAAYRQLQKIVAKADAGMPLTDEESALLATALERLAVTRELTDDDGNPDNRKE